MGIVRLGALQLRWCFTCNLPILRQKKCSICESETEQVSVTPPGDIRPAFNFDISLIRSCIDEQFGKKTGKILIPPGEIVLLNRAPGLDTIDEIIIYGVVVGSLVYDFQRSKFKVLLRLEGAGIISDSISRGYITVDDGAVQPILSGASVLIPGISEFSDNIETGDEIIVFSPSKKILATGMAKLNSSEIGSRSKGSAVKTRWYGDYKSVNHSKQPRSWADVIKANAHEMDTRVGNALSFINKVVNETGKPVVVSFSGGKDSLATLLLVLESKIQPKMIFIDTGLELPETVEFTHEISHRYNLDLQIESASDSFWINLPFFGPPGKDFRWCCKTSKLGPASRLIKREYPEGVLSFIGQRSYESEPRSKKGAVWKNPWVPGQNAASPIQRWTALHVWLYLFSRDAPINPWYERGLDRIGCWLCPASNLSELDAIRSDHEQFKQWEEYLEEYSLNHGFDEQWLKFGLWRWKNPPKEIMKQLDVDPDKISRGCVPKHFFDSTGTKGIEGTEVYSVRNYRCISLGGFEDCKGEMSLEGVFDFDFDFERISNLLNILGESKKDENARSCMIDTDITVFSNGTISIKGHDKKSITKVLKDIHNLIVRSLDCVDCGICESRCSTGALKIESGLQLDPKKCTHCKKCLGPCTVINFDIDKSIGL